MIPPLRWVEEHFQVLKTIDLTSQSKLIDSEFYSREMVKLGCSPYRLLSYLSNKSKVAAVIFDLGTGSGANALALSHCPYSRVISYDTELKNKINKKPDNITFKTGDWTKDPDLKDTDFIHVSLDPFDGIAAKEVDEYLRMRYYSGVAVYNNIHLNADMEAWWTSVPFDDKWDLTSIGAWYGTGMVKYEP